MNIVAHLRDAANISRQNLEGDIIEVFQGKKRGYIEYKCVNNSGLRWNRKCYLNFKLTSVLSEAKEFTVGSSSETPTSISFTIVRFYLLSQSAAEEAISFS